MLTPEQISRYYAKRGMTTIEAFDRDRMLSILREQRARYAHQEEYAAMGDAAQILRRVIRDDGMQLDAATASDTLLAVSSILGTFVASGMHATAVLNVMAYLADDLAKEAGR